MTEVTENQVQTLSMNDKEYKVEDLSEKAKYLISQLQDMQGQENQARARIDQIQVGITGFTNLLQQELENPDDDEEVVNQTKKRLKSLFFYLSLIEISVFYSCDGNSLRHFRNTRVFYRYLVVLRGSDFCHVVVVKTASLMTFNLIAL